KPLMPTTSPVHPILFTPLVADRAAPGRTLRYSVALRPTRERRSSCWDVMTADFSPLSVTATSLALALTSIVSLATPTSRLMLRVLLSELVRAIPVPCHFLKPLTSADTL